MADNEGPSPSYDGPELRLPNGAMNPDHPLLAPLQVKLKEQLVKEKQRVEGELREKENQLKVSS